MYGLAANLASAPVSDFLIMPMLALGALLEPLGLGGPFLWLAGKGIGLMLAIGAWTAGLPGAVRTVASAPDYVLPLSFLGVLFCCLWRGPLRWLGLPLAAAVMLWSRDPPPDLWIGDGGTQAAWMSAGGATVMRAGVRQFAVDVWSRRRGLAPMPRAPEGWVCTRFSCAPATIEAGPLTMWWGTRLPSAEQLGALCRTAAVVSVRTEVGALPASCKGRLVLDGLDYVRGGAVELWRDGPPSAGRWRAVWSADVRGSRPWSETAGVGPAGVSDSGG
jgi:competence protein ComEC